MVGGMFKECMFIDIYTIGNIFTLLLAWISIIIFLTIQAGQKAYSYENNLYEA